MAPKKQHSKAEGGKKKENNKEGGNKAKEDDECADMPPLEDMRKTDATGGVKEKEKGKKEIKLPEPRWSQGQASRRVSFPKKEVQEAYRFLGIEPTLSSDKLYAILEEKSQRMLIDDTSDLGSLPASMGAILLPASMGAILSIACSRYDVLEQSSAVLLPIIQRVYIYEANYHLQQIGLPLPRHLPEFDKPLVMEIMRDGSRASTSWDTLKELQSARIADKARIAISEKEAKESKGALEKLKTELVEYKAEVKEGYKARDEKAAELEKVKSEKEVVKSELEKEKSEVAKLKAELAKLRASPSSSSSSQAASPDKTTFVIKSLSRQVKDLGRQVKEKNDQLAEMMVEMSKVGFE